MISFFTRFSTTSIIACIIGSMFVSLAFLADNTVEDPVISVRKHIERIAAEIKASGVNASCETYFGKDMMPVYKTLTHTPDQQEQEQKEKDLSKKFIIISQQLDSMIFDTIVRPYATSNFACSREKYDYITAELRSIYSEKNALYGTILNNTTLYQTYGYGKEYDEQSPHMVIFEETKALATQLQEKFKMITQATHELGEGKGTKTPWSWQITENERQRIAENAQERAAAYTDDFWGGISINLFEPLYAERHSILRNLKGLPEKKSKFTSVWNGHASEVLSESTQKTLQKKTTEYFQSAFVQQDSLLPAIEQNKIIITELNQFIDQTAKAVSKEEDMIELSRPYIESIIHASEPIHQSVLITTEHLESLTGSTERRNQNHKKY